MHQINNHSAYESCTLYSGLSTSELTCCDYDVCCMCSMDRPLSYQPCPKTVHWDDSLFCCESIFGACDSEGSEEENSGGNDAVSTNISDRVTQTLTYDVGLRTNSVRQNNVKSLSIITWNVCGIISKLFDNDFVSFVSSFNIICFVETFVEKLNITGIFNGYEVYCCPSVKLSKTGRPSGGVIALIKSELMPFFTRVEVKFGNILAFIVDKSVFGVAKNVVLIFTYIPPEGSRYYSHFGYAEDGISLIENCLVEVINDLNDYYVIITGDLNSRTANASQPVLYDNCVVDDLCVSQPISDGRRSQDSVINGFGKSLLNMCTSFNLGILNGRCNGDPEGRYTYITDMGSSVVDYFVMSCDLLAYIWDHCHLSVQDRSESDHLPVVLSIALSEPRVVNNSGGREYVDRFMWDSNKKETFINAFKLNHIKSKLTVAVEQIDVNIDIALDTFNNCIREAANCMKKRVPVINGKKLCEWFDHECASGRRNVRRLLKIHRRTLHSTDRHAFCKSRREYKNMLYRKKKMFNNAAMDRLLSVIDDQQSFWKTVRKIVPNRNYISNAISIEEWYKHFKDLLELDSDGSNIGMVNDDMSRPNDMEGGSEIEYALDTPITAEEVRLAIMRLKSKKAAGPDGLISELFKNAGDVIVPFFVKFLNKLFDNGIFPKEWTESIILPLYKKGDVNNPRNYRGISICNISSKIFGAILNRRIQKWVEYNNCTGEWQAGFKQGYSTIDHMFTLMACVQKQLCLNRKLYVAFIDIEKCFDTINRTLLWSILEKNGIRGKMLQCLKSMYSNVCARIRHGSEVSSVIKCSLGVKQGDVCSPVLCSLYINEIAKNIIDKGKHGVTFFNDLYELLILLLADDIVLFSETVVGLQSQLNNLQQAVSYLALKVNMDKSEIIVFRKGGYLSGKEKWTYNGVIMPVVNMYKYLGIYFSTRLSFTAACRDIGSKAKNALLNILHKMKKFENRSLDIFLKLFDFQIQPIMQYGSEIWGMEGAAQQCEKIHLYALKRILCVDMRTPNDLIYSELNRYPVVINSILSCIRYWTRLLEMGEWRIPKKAYIMLKTLDERDKKTWVTNIRLCLYENGFGYVWESQGVGNTKMFLRTFKQRLIDCRWQECHGHIQASERFSVYRSFISLQSIPMYLRLNINNHLKICMTKFRFGVSQLTVHFYRYRSCTNRQLLCPMCKQAVEDEVHFILSCPFLHDLRVKLIAEKFYKEPNAFRLSCLLAVRNELTVKNLLSVN